MQMSAGEIVKIGEKMFQGVSRSVKTKKPQLTRKMVVKIRKNML